MYSYQQVLEIATRQLETTLNNIARMRNTDVRHTVTLASGVRPEPIDELSPSEAPLTPSDTVYMELVIDGSVIVSEALLLSPGYNPDVLPTRYEQLARMLLHSIFTSGVTTFYAEVTGMAPFQPKE